MSVLPMAAIPGLAAGATIRA